MAFMRRLHKTSTAKMLSLSCFPSLADLIVLSGFLSLEYPSSLYITYSYGYHQKAWQKPALLKCLLYRVFPCWLIGRIEWIPSTDNSTLLLDKTSVRNFVFLIYDPFIWLSSEGLVKPALRKCLPCRVFPRWLLYRIEWISPVDNSTFHITYSHGNYKKTWQNQHC